MADNDSHVGEGDENEEEEKRDEYIIIATDGGWGWIVVIAAFICNCIVDGVIFNYGQYLGTIQDHYNVDSHSVALIGSLMYGVHLSAGIFCSPLLKAFGIRIVVIAGSVITFLSLVTVYFQPPFWFLALSLGVFCGIGMSLIYIPTLVITTMYFDRLRIIAVGIVVSGTGAGTLIFSLAGREMMKTMGWIEAYITLAFLCLIISLAALTYKPILPVKKSSLSSTASISGPEKNVVLRRSRDESDPMDTYLGKYAQDVRDTNNSWADYCCGVRKSKFGLVRTRRYSRWMYEEGNRWTVLRTALRTMRDDWKLLRNLNFSLYIICICCAGTAAVVIFTFAVERAKDQGHTPEDASVFIAILGGSNMISRLVLAFLGTLPGVNYYALHIGGHILGGISIISSTFLQEIKYQYTFFALYGITLGGLAVFIPIILLELVGMENLTKAVGVSLFFCGFITVLGVPIAGYIADLHGNYEIVFWIAGSLNLILAFLLIFVSKAAKRNNVARQATLPSP